MIPKTIVHLLSGGLDSVTLLHHLVHNEGNSVHCLLFNYKQRHVQELEWAKYHAKSCGCLYTVYELPELGGLTEQSWIVPNRNAIFLSIAVNVACQANADTVTIGCNADDESMFPDCRKEFMDSMNATVKAAGYEVEICAPWIYKRKWEIMRIAQDMGVRLSNIWSCYKGGEKPCGECPACQKLNDAQK